MIKILNTIRLNIVGDTIVEVLIATAIVSLILSGAYATSTRSLKTTRQAEERVEALKYTESQVERLRIASTIVGPNCSSTDIFCATVADFCFDNTGQKRNFAPLPAPSSSAASDGFTTYPTTPNNGCKYSTGGVTYYTWIHRDDPSPLTPPASRTFTIHARWPSYGSSVNDEVTLSYRMTK